MQSSDIARVYLKDNSVYGDISIGEGDRVQSRRKSKAERIVAFLDYDHGEGVWLYDDDRNPIALITNNYIRVIEYKNPKQEKIDENISG